MQSLEVGTCLIFQDYPGDQSGWSDKREGADEW